jgi:dipeptidyl aminopeptidase/acylaminoacyl peptidase
MGVPKEVTMNPADLRASSRRSICRRLLALAAAMALAGVSLCAQEVFSPADLLQLKTVIEARISPDGRWIAGVVSTQRPAGDEPGGNYAELYVWDAASGQCRPFVTGKVSVRAVQWSPDGKRIGFLQKRGDKAKTQVWAIPADGGEAVALTKAETDVLEFRWRPAGGGLAYIATTPPTARATELDKKGYGFVFYEENLKPRNVYLQPPPPADGTLSDAQSLTEGITVWQMEWAPDGKTLALGASPRNLVDQEYMDQTIRLLDVEKGELRALADPGGKLGRFSWSPTGTRIAYVAAKERKDHAASQLFVVDVAGGAPRNLTPPDFRGHVSWADWQDTDTVVYLSGEGVWNTLATDSAAGGRRQVRLHGREAGLVFDTLSWSRDGKHWALLGQTAANPAEVYAWDGREAPRRLSDVNPWLAQRALGRQEVVRYPSRDGFEIEGLLLSPAGYESGRKYPLIVIVHGGPESHYANGWVTRYSEPAQVLAGKGYAVFLPNYRASTGYGLEFAWAGYGDPAGKEFDDVADGIDFLIKQGLADSERIGLTGGSYGGYAAAWFATWYTRYVRAVCMFVGISDLVSKRGTTDIPYEELYVHSGQDLDRMWDLSRERSPITHAKQSRTAVLILGGTDDPRVHPSQSLEFYRRLKMTGHPAVRLVQYPGEGHGNRRQPGRIDVLYRQLEWFDWYVRDLKPLDGPLPRLDISDRYGLNLEE